MRGGGKNSHDVLVNLDGAIYIATNSKKEKAAALISWLVKKDVEKVLETKDSTIGLLNGDIEEQSREIIILEQDSEKQR